LCRPQLVDGTGLLAELGVYLEVGYSDVVYYRQAFSLLGTIPMEYQVFLLNLYPHLEAIELGLVVATIIGVPLQLACLAWLVSYHRSLNVSWKDWAIECCGVR
jgi:hypothetical protein